MSLPLSREYYAPWPGLASQSRAWEEQQSAMREEEKERPAQEMKRVCKVSSRVSGNEGV
jgi:hypothetical protein